MKKYIQPKSELFYFEAESSFLLPMSLHEEEEMDEAWTKKKDFDNSSPWSSNKWQNTNQ